jgi:hypothetical protein
MSNNWLGCCSNSASGKKKRSGNPAGRSSGPHASTACNAVLEAMWKPLVGCFVREDARVYSWWVRPGKGNSTVPDKISEKVFAVREKYYFFYKKKL